MHMPMGYPKLFPQLSLFCVTHTLSK